MGELRASISRRAPPSEVAAHVETLQQLFDEAEAALSPDRASALSSFLGAFTILLREGLEALLIVVALGGVLGTVGVQAFDRDLAPQALVLGQIHGRHTARPKPVKYAISPSQNAGSRPDFHSEVLPTRFLAKQERG